MIEITIAPPPKSLNWMLNAHHMTRHKVKKAIRDMVWGQLIGQRYAGNKPVIIHATRYAIKQLDGFDNFPGSLKWVVDALSRLGVFPDDTDEWVSTGELKQVRVRKRKEERLVMRIEERKDE